MFFLKTVRHETILKKNNDLSYISKLTTIEKKLILISANPQKSLIHESLLRNLNVQCHGHFNRVSPHFSWNTLNCFYKINYGWLKKKHTLPCKFDYCFNRKYLVYLRTLNLTMPIKGSNSKTDKATQKQRRTLGGVEPEEFHFLEILPIYLYLFKF